MILVLVMTLSLAGLAISAIYLMSSANLLTSYYDKERNFRYGAEAALALAKSRATHDTTLLIPEDTALKFATASSLKDAAGNTISGVTYNTYMSFTGDTSGRYGKFITILSQSYDTGGTRTVRRLDLTSESFSRYAMFTDSFPSGLSYGSGEFIRGRAHSNTNWNAASGSTFYDTVSVPTGGTIQSGPTYTNGTTYTNGRIPFPTVAKLAALPGYATSGNLNFTPVSGTATRDSLGGVTELSGRQTNATTAAKGTRIRFKYFDKDLSGVIEEAEGFMEVFDLAAGMDTSSLRVDLLRGGSAPVKSIVMLNQCGILATINTTTPSHKEFFPVARFKEPWVVHRIRANGNSPGWTSADSTTVVAGNAAAYSKIMGAGVGMSRCFPPGSPYLMLAERNVLSGTCAISTDTTSTTIYGWGALTTGGGCTTAKQYGGQDTTFTAVVYRCYYDQTVTTGQCKSGTMTNSAGSTYTGSQVKLGAWRVFPGTAMSGLPASKIDVSEASYLWPLYKPYNLSARGVVHSTGRLYMSDTLRGNITLYALGSVIFIDDTVYDLDPTAGNALCRNFLGIIARDSVMIADNALNRPRTDPNGVVRFLGTPDATLHMITMSLTATVGVEAYGTGPAESSVVPALTTPVFSGGYVKQSGGVIEKFMTATYGGAGTGLQENRTVDPCQLTNHKPPFFPQTGRYLDNKYYEIDPTKIASWAAVKNFMASLRGKSVP